MQGDEKQKQDRSLEDTKENVGRTEEQGSFEEKERKSYGRKGKRRKSGRTVFSSYYKIED